MKSAKARTTTWGTSVSCLVVLTVVLTCCCDAVPKKKVNNKELYESLLNDVLAALMKVVQFFSTDYSEVNMDGLFGVRLCQGSLIGILQDCSQVGFNCPSELTDQLRDMNGRLDDLGSKSLPYIKEQDEDYYNIFLPTIEASFTVKHVPEELYDFNVTAESKIKYDGKLGNKCFGNILGTLKDSEGRTSSPCTITEDCWQSMTTNGTVGYYTTHQLLYFIYGVHSGCEHALEEHIRQHGGTSVKDYERYLCQQIYYDATLRDQGGKMETPAEDLFMEQSLLCGILGFQYFLSEKWMRMVLSWQSNRGCFTNPAPIMNYEMMVDEKMFEINKLEKQLSKEGEHMDQATSDMIRQRISALTEQAKQLSRVLYQQLFIIDSVRGVWRRRKLLSEKIMGGDCLAHKTGLGAGTLATYMRYLTRQLYGHN